MDLIQPYYFEPRKDDSHIDLGGQWSFFGSEVILENFTEDMWKYNTTIPRSLYHSMHEAGILPDPYWGDNSKYYKDLDEQVWYYRKKFTLDERINGKTAILAFDGVSYYSRLWINGELIGDHEGMFGGPVYDATEKLHVGENEIVVETKAFNYGCKEECKFVDNYYRTYTQLMPWNLAKDNAASNGHFTIIGIWNNVRLELLEPLHLSRPYLYTESVTDYAAKLRLDVQLIDGTLTEIRKFHGNKDKYTDGYTFCYGEGLSGIVKDKKVKIVTEITEPDTKRVVYRSEDMEDLVDYTKMYTDSPYEEYQYFTKDIVIEKPRLWYPHTMGEPYCYDVKISLFDGEKLCDTHEFKTGIRTFEENYTSGRKYAHRWGKYHFSVNGEPIFLKALNWMCADFLYYMDPKEYEWAINMVKEAGIEMLRVWNGGSYPEWDKFYELCDEYGIMVWQDMLLCNTESSKDWNFTLVESQLAYNIYRIRNHPSLVILCGGNEFNAFNDNNAGVMFVQTRLHDDLAPHTVFKNTTPEKGSCHMYANAEPSWLRHSHRDLAFIGETGLHCFPSYGTYKKLLPEYELVTKLPDLADPSFPKNFPNMLNHFTEYNPKFVPRLMSRSSQIINVKDMYLEDLCEASQVQVCEFYTLAVQSMRERYPSCGGINLWVFKRHWTTAGVQLVDGMGQPARTYYAVKNVYKKNQIIWSVPWTIIAPGETMPLDLVVQGDGHESLLGAQARLTIYRPDLTVEKVVEARVDGHNRSFNLGEFTPDEKYTDKAFLVSAELIKNGVRLHETTYFIRCTSVLADPETYKKYRTTHCGNMTFENGPWVKPCIKAAGQAKLTAKLVDKGMAGNYHYYDVRVENVSRFPAYPVTFQLDEETPRHYESDAMFMLRPGDSRVIRITTDSDKDYSAKDIEVRFWNGEYVRATEL